MIDRNLTEDIKFRYICPAIEAKDWIKDRQYIPQIPDSILTSIQTFLLVMIIFLSFLIFISSPQISIKNNHFSFILHQYGYIFLQQCELYPLGIFMLKRQEVETVIIRFPALSAYHRLALPGLVRDTCLPL